MAEKFSDTIQTDEAKVAALISGAQRQAGRKGVTPDQWDMMTAQLEDRASGEHKKGIEDDLKQQLGEIVKSGNILTAEQQIAALELGVDSTPETTNEKPSVKTLGDNLKQARLQGVTSGPKLGSAERTTDEIVAAKEALARVYAPGEEIKARFARNAQIRKELNL